jgi:hypothetical protein
MNSDFDEVAFGSWLVDRMNEYAGKPEEAGLRMVLNHWSGLESETCKSEGASRPMTNLTRQFLSFRDNSEIANLSTDEALDEFLDINGFRADSPEVIAMVNELMAAELM